MFSKEQIKKLRSEFSKINKVDPTGPAGKKLMSFMDGRSRDELKALADADIKFVSMLAKNRLRESVDIDEATEGQAEIIKVAIRRLKERPERGPIEIWKRRDGIWDFNRASNSVGHKEMKKIGARLMGYVTERGYKRVNENTLQEATFSANLSDDEYQKIRRASMRGNFAHKFSRKTNGDTKFSTNLPKKLAADLEKIIDSRENSWNEILGIDAAEVKSKGKTKRTFAHMENTWAPGLFSKPLATVEEETVEESTSHDTGWRKAGPKVVTDKAGNKHTAISRVRHLARMGRSEAEKEKNDKKGVKTEGAKKATYADRADLIRSVRHKKGPWSKTHPNFKATGVKDMKKESIDESKESIQKQIDALKKQLATTKESTQLDEISTKSKINYITKASNDLESAIHLSQHGSDKNTRDRNTRKAKNRRAGITRAYTSDVKRVKESTRLHELSTGLLKRYIKVGNYAARKRQNTADRAYKSADDAIDKGEAPDSPNIRATDNWANYNDKRAANHRKGVRTARKKLSDRLTKESVEESTAASNPKLAAQLAARKAQREKIKSKKAGGVKKTSAPSTPANTGKNATDDRHIIMQLRSAQDLNGNKDIQFRRGTGKLDKATIDTLLKVHDKLTKPNDKRRLFIAVSKSAEDAKKTAAKFSHLKL